MSIISNLEERFTLDESSVSELERIAVVDILSKRKRSRRGRAYDSFPTVILDTIEALGSPTRKELELALRRSTKKAVLREKEERGDEFVAYVKRRIGPSRSSVVNYYLNKADNDDPSLPEAGLIGRLIDGKLRYSLLYASRATKA